jgi:DNA polymerase III alpha subunit
MAPKEAFDLVVNETPWAFCKAHAMSFAQFTKQTSVLKSLHRNIYLSEIAKWEDRNGFVWDDIGMKIKGVSLLQH